MAAPVIPGTPDYQQGVANAQQVMGIMTNPTAQLVVGVPPNCESLLVFSNQAGTDQIVSVQGITSGIVYPTANVTGAYNQCFSVTPMAPAVDSQVRVSVTRTNTNTFYVVADMGVRTFFDPILDSVVVPQGFPISGNGLMIAGSDGTDSRLVQTDAVGRLIPHGPDSAVSATVSSTGTPLLAAIGNGHYYLYGWDVYDLTGAAEIATLLVNGAPISSIVVGASPAANQAFSVPLNGYKTNGAVSALGSGGVNSAVVTLRLALGP